MDIKTVGPYGGTGGGAFDDGYHTSIQKIILGWGEAIDSIQLVYDVNGQSVTSAKHGGSGGGITTIGLDFPNEYVKLVSGYYGDFEGSTVIKGITFQTNKTTYGPFGTQQSTSFSFPSFDGKIIGFFGRSGYYLDSIGAYVQPTTNLAESVGTPDAIGANVDPIPNLAESVGTPDAIGANVDPIPNI